MNPREVKDNSSFRDPSGTIYYKEGILFRQINNRYAKQYAHLKDSGLYRDLVDKGFLIAHEERIEACPFPNGLLVIRPDRVPFISYPYEWSFSALKDAALLTLRIHRRALEFGMVLKDASAYNVQFVNGNPVFIDTLSFDFYIANRPWLAYGQFCRHFLAPLLLMSHVDVRLGRLLNNYIDGIPIDLADHILKGRGGFLARQHIHWQAAFIERYSDTSTRLDDKKQVRSPALSLSKQQTLIDSLLLGIEKISFSRQATEWANYTARTSYSEPAADAKRTILSDFLERIRPKTVWDLGSNDGAYSIHAAKTGAQTVAFDADPAALDQCYLRTKGQGLSLLPLLADLTNPSASIGFAGRERMSMAQRGRPDCIMILAVIHHLSISNNIPFDLLAKWLSEMTDSLIIEFVPKSDPQVLRLLSSREDIFDFYTQELFESSFSSYFDWVERRLLIESDRILYLFQKTVDDNSI